MISIAKIHYVYYEHALFLSHSPKTGIWIV